MGKKLWWIISEEPGKIRLIWAIVLLAMVPFACEFLKWLCQ